MGLSFTVASAEQQACVILRLDGGRYLLDEKGEETDSVWRRESLPQVDIPITVSNGKAEFISDLEQYGMPGLRLFVRVSGGQGKNQLTVCVINSIEDDGSLDFQARNEHCLFQSQMTIYVGEDTEFVPRRATGTGKEKDDRLNSLLYRETKEFATGHTCSAMWDEEQVAPQWISTTWVPVQKVDDVDPNGDPLLKQRLSERGFSGYSAEDMHTLDDPELFNLLETLPAVYSDWLEQERASSNGLDADHKKIADGQFDEAKSVIERMNSSIECLKKDKRALKAFRLANKAMQRQMHWQGFDLVWRPFQIGFALLTLRSLVMRDQDRDIMDLLWFPTGGGKTEAYLLLMAFVLFFRRLERGSLAKDDGVCVVTRYTLRALTTDQFERTVSMICACELIRRESDKNATDVKSFSLALWIGSGSTPNTYADAKASLNGTFGATPSVIEACPLCRNSLVWSADDTKEEIHCRCSSSDCEIADKLDYLPIHTVDEQIYRHHPSIVIGTVDKFAQVCRFPLRTNGLFNIGSDYLPPDLIVQDELHLISGPLGTTTGLMELAIDWLCSSENKRPKIIGSTATIQSCLLYTSPSPRD